MFRSEGNFVFDIKTISFQAVTVATEAYQFICDAIEKRRVNQYLMFIIW
jgi:hypothetical protein